MTGVIRPTQAADLPILVEMAVGTLVFKAVEIVALEEVLTDFLKAPGGEGYHCYTYEDATGVLGFVCHGPNTMTDGTWDLYWIVVTMGKQAAGIGGQLLRFAEEDVRRQGGRLVLIETSSLPAYIPTRRFYLKHGYEQTAVVKDFYADGDSLVLFRKRLRGEETAGEAAVDSPR